MPHRVIRRTNEGKLSKKLLRWIEERVARDDPIRIPLFEEYKLNHVLGKGRFGEVIKYTNTRTMVSETVKNVNMDLFDHWTQDSEKLSAKLDIFLSELRHLHKVSFANDKIANFIGIYADHECLLVFSEYLPRGSVYSKIQQETLSEEVAIRYFTQALDALEYLHNLSPPLIHRDLKAANLLLTISDSVKLANFGLVRDLAIDGFGLGIASEISLDFRASLLYIAPEVLNSELGPGDRNAYGPPADIWALGCTFIEMLIKHPPHFEYFGHVEEIKTELLGYAQKRKNETGLPYTADILVPSSSVTTQRIVDAVFEPHPRKRPTATRMKQIVAAAKEQRILDELEFDSTPQSTVDGGEQEESKSSDLTGFPLFGFMQNGLFPMQAEGKTEEKFEVRQEPHPLTLFLLHYSTRTLYFFRILTNSIIDLLIFLVIGIGFLLAFLFVSYNIVTFFRYLASVYCNCELNDPHHVIISGILVILMFALLFSCCMVALGEYKYRMANRTFRKSRFFVSRPDKSSKMCGIVIFSGKEERNRNNDECELESGTRFIQQQKTHDDELYNDAP